MEVLFVFLLALVLDFFVGEPPRPVHPVVWMGKLISLLERIAFPRDSRAQFIYGSIMCLLTILVFVLPVYFLLSFLHDLNSIAYVFLAALLLKSTFAFRELRQTALMVKSFLSQDNLKKARAAMPALVSRDTQGMGKPELVSATIESVAENICDSFIAPLFYFLFLGVSGAIAYRVVNTLDAMIGYHGEWEYLGKFAARLDDILNFVPARISGLLLVAAAYLYHKDGKSAWRIMLRDHYKTESPNAGWTISAMAGALGTRLEKRAYYTLGDSSNPLSNQLIGSGVRLLDISALLWVGLYFIMEVMFFVFIA
ncbi:MAG: cobalamin biosynthesis protein [Chloroflexota bacterium]|nr:cobalamin biosynthesis protein [Chloroflexota bacterium]